MAMVNPQYQQQYQWRATDRPDLASSPPAASMSYGGAGVSMNYGADNFDNVRPFN